jgi:transient receptor potential cation channel subfamily M protein 3
LCCRYASESGEQTVLESMKDYLISTIQRTFEVGVEQAECLYSELLQCTHKKNLVSSRTTEFVIDEWNLLNVC